jgi:hypothetical protein
MPTFVAGCHSVPHPSVEVPSSIVPLRGLRSTIQHRSPGVFEQATDPVRSSANVHDPPQLRLQMRPRAESITRRQVIAFAPKMMSSRPSTRRPPQS